MARRLFVRSDLGEWTVTLEDDRATVVEVGATFVVREESDGRYRLEDANGVLAGAAARSGDTIWVGLDGEALPFRVSASDARDRAAGRGHDVLTPPMPATVVRIAVHAGDRVAAGDILIVLEAMKMELPIRAPRDGTIAAIHCVEGQLVQPDQDLIDLT